MSSGNCVVTALRAIQISNEHANAAAIKGQNPTLLIDTACAQIREATLVLKEIVKTAPPSDPNVAKINEIVAGLR
jgi:hypothetical protein